MSLMNRIAKARIEQGLCPECDREPNHPPMHRGAAMRWHAGPEYRVSRRFTARDLTGAVRA